MAKEKQLIKVKPAPGRRVRCWRTLRVISDEGMHVDPTDLYYFRRLRDGDLIEINEDGTEKTEGTLMQLHGIAVAKPAAAAPEKAD
jgi:hypothetical protein